jgi:hypothetical protein
MPRLQLQLERGAYAPAETVRGWVRALEGGRSRAGTAVLRYVERTDDYTEIAWEKAVPLWEGDLAEGASFAFEIQLPPDARPAYTSDNGSLAWEALVRSDEFGRDTTASQELELTPPPDGYPAPAPPAAPGDAPAWVKPMTLAAPAIGGVVGYSIARIPGAIGGVALIGGGTVLERRRRAKHFEVGPPPPVRRGERARVAVRMLDAGKVEGELHAELECVERYDYRSHSSRGGSSRETKEETLHVERVPLGTAGRSADIEVPAGMPFTHQGSCLSYLWKAVVREHRENALDRVAEHSLEVLP